MKFVILSLMCYYVLCISKKIRNRHATYYFPFTNKLPPTTPMEILTDDLEYIREISKLNTSNKTSKS